MVIQKPKIVDLPKKKVVFHGFFYVFPEGKRGHDPLLLIQALQVAAAAAAQPLRRRCSAVEAALQLTAGGAERQQHRPGMVRWEKLGKSLGFSGEVIRKISGNPPTKYGKFNGKDRGLKWRFTATIRNPKSHSDSITSQRCYKGAISGAMLYAI